MEKIDESPNDDVARLVEQYLEQVDDHTDVSLEELCRDVPHLKDKVAREIDILNRMDRVLDSNPDKPENLYAGDWESRVQPGQRNGNAVAESNYVVTRFLARGGCSEVYLARDDSLGRNVAIKFLRPRMKGQHRFAARLQQEAQITSRLDHPGIVSIHAQGTDEEGVPFYAMRYVDGNSLYQEIRSFHKKGIQTDPAGFRKLLNHFVDVCQAVAYAHSLGIIHRDIKPQNIVTGSFGETYVVDWGLAKYLDQPEESIPSTDVPFSSRDTATEPLTEMGATLGTPQYLSPEQALGTSVGISSDVFNLGATLYCLLTGSPPYQDESIVRILQCARQVKFAPVREVNSDVPKPLAAICERAMHLDPDQRYESAAGIARDLEQYLIDEPVEAYQDSLVEIARRWTKKHRSLVAAVIAAGVVAIIILSVATNLLLTANQNLADRESEAIELKEETRLALVQAQKSLYAQQIALADSEIKKNNVVRAIEILDACPEDYRSLEWYLLRSVTKRHQPVFEITTDGAIARGISFSPDGKLFAVGHSKGLVVLYDMDQPQPFEEPVAELEDGMDVRQLAISPNKDRLVVVGNELRNGRIRGAVHIWDLETKKLLRRRWGHGSLVHCVAWSRDGSQIATGGNSGGIRVRTPDTLEPVLRINEAHDGPIRAIRFSGFNLDELITAGEDGLVNSWDGQGNRTSSRKAHEKSVNCLALRGEHVITGGSDRLVRIRSANRDDDSEDRFLVGHRDQVESIDISPDGMLLATGSLDRNVRIWNVNTGEPLTMIRYHSSHVRRTKFDPRGRYLVTSGDDGQVRIWDLNKMAVTSPVGNSVKFSKQSNRMLAIAPKQSSMWDAEQNQSLEKHVAGDSVMLGGTFANQTELHARFFHDGSILVLDPESVVTKRLISENGSSCFCGVFSPDDKRLFTGHKDGTIYCWNVESGKVESTTKLTGRVNALGLTADQQILVASSWDDGSLTCWNSQSMDRLGAISAHPDRIMDIAIHPFKPHVATTGPDGMVRIWEPVTGKKIDEFKFGASWLNCLEYSPDGKRLVTGSEHTLMFWNPETRKEVLSMSVERCIHSISFSRDSRYLAVAGEDPRIRIWQVGPEIVSD